MFPESVSQCAREEKSITSEELDPYIEPNRMVDGSNDTVLGANSEDGRSGSCVTGTTGAKCMRMRVRIVTLKSSYRLR